MYTYLKAEKRNIFVFRRCFLGLRQIITWVITTICSAILFYLMEQCSRYCIHPVLSRQPCYDTMATIIICEMKLCDLSLAFESLCSPSIFPVVLV